MSRVSKVQACMSEGAGLFYSRHITTAQWNSALTRIWTESVGQIKLPVLTLTRKTSKYKKTASITRKLTFTDSPDFYDVTLLSWWQKRPMWPCIDNNTAKTVNVMKANLCMKKNMLPSVMFNYGLSNWTTGRKRSRSASIQLTDK